MQRQDLGNVHPGDAIHTRAEDEHVREEERDGPRSECFPARRIITLREKSGDKHHGDTETRGAPEHCAPATHFVQSERGDKGAEREHELDAAGDDLGETVFEADVCL